MSLSQPVLDLIHSAPRGMGVSKIRRRIESELPGITLNDRDLRAAVKRAKATNLWTERVESRILPPSCLTEAKQRTLTDSQIYRALIISDLHGWLIDMKAWRCLLNVVRSNPFDEIITNGDITDLPYISKHSGKLYENGILKGYSEVEEIRYTREEILTPLRSSTKAEIRARLGNHDERITKPFNISQSQLARLAVLYQHYNTTSYREMLGLTRSDWIYDETDVYRMFDIFDVCHGLKLSKNASRQNITDYMSSGSTGHTHRINSTYITNKNAPYVWFESGCMRLTKEVEYFPTAVVPDWQQGFIDLTFVKDSDGTRFFGEPHIILDGICKYNGNIYRG